MRTPRFGASIRKLCDKADRSKRSAHECPKCGKKKLVHAKTYAVWRCNSCKATVAGAAYSPTSESGQIAYRLSKTYVNQ
jgi:ribosomal protein L37AE/L43A